MATSTYTPLYTTSLTSQSSVTFSSIPQTYTDLIVVIQGVYSSNQPANFQVGNGSVDTGTNYSRTGLSGNGSSAISYRGSSESYFYTDNAGDASGGATNITQIMNYSNTTTYKTFLNRNGATSNNVRAITGLWRSTSAINIITITLGATFTGGTISLYGISAAPSAKATGGMITSDATYYYHTFTSTGTFTPTQSLSADILTIAGGGGSGGDVGGGGGAGRVYYNAATTLASSTAYTCTIGAGGAAGGTTSAAGLKGTDSSFIGGAISYTSLGGGGGNGRTPNSAANTGWNGGGGSYDLTTGTAGLGGYAGGNTVGGGTSTCYSGGGGGAVEAGGTDGSGQGGDGTNSYSDWGLATGTGQLVSSTYYYAGGGGGSFYSGATQSLGGDGGGGKGGGDSVFGTVGTANSGGGAGGSGTTKAGVAGGSGIVIVRYAK